MNYINQANLLKHRRKLNHDFITSLSEQNFSKINYSRFSSKRMFFWIYYSRISLKHHWKIDCNEKHRNSKYCFCFYLFFLRMSLTWISFFSLAQIKNSEIDFFSFYHFFIFSFYHLSCKNELRSPNQPAICQKMKC